MLRRLGQIANVVRRAGSVAGAGLRRAANVAGMIQSGVRGIDKALGGGLGAIVNSVPVLHGVERAANAGLNAVQALNNKVNGAGGVNPFVRSILS